jgi:uncharacterized protein YxjI
VADAVVQVRNAIARNTYGVEVEPGVDDALIIAIAVCVDRSYEDEKREREHRERGGF